MSRKIKLIGILLLNFSSLCFSQQTEDKSAYYIQPEYMIGKIIPNQLAVDFPTLKAQHLFALSIGSTNLDTNSWGKYYNFPESGIMLAYANLGNNKIMGHQLSFVPYVTFKVFNKFSDSYRLKLGAGISYFNTFYDSISNPTNDIIGSHFTWDVKVFLYREIIKSEKFNLRAGVGFSHESNGHTQIPNLGINSFLFSISSQFHNQKIDKLHFPKRRKGVNHSPKKHFINIQQGIGFHEQDPTEGPMVNRKKPVYSTSLSYGTIYNNHIKFRLGLVYRFYEQFNTHLKENEIDGLSENRTLSSSNVILFVGNEFLMSHFAFDIRFGINLYKPFYRKFNSGTDIGTKLRKTFSSRVGLNVYLKNTNKLPKHNFFIGAHINANMGKADFTEFSFGYTFLLKNN
ncbi:MAG: acyloxyacyl hydrolase [Flavobacteriales bacterium]|nr:acyloxyacyl hydrolase [Flavobacteriales bacterium]